MNEKIIEFVRNNRILYDKSEPGYKNVKLKEDKWSLLASELETTIAAVKKRWTTLRDFHVKQIRKRHANEYHKPWKYMSSLQFLSIRQKKDTKCLKSRTEKCRICLIETNNPTIDLKNVFSNFVDGENFHQIYEYCIGTALDTDISALSKAICIKCETNLVNSFKFKKQCLETERIVRYQFKKVKSEISAMQLEESQPNIKIEETTEFDVEGISEIYAHENTVELDVVGISENSHENTIENNEQKQLETIQSDSNKPNHRKRMALCPICGKLVKKVYMSKHLRTHENMTQEQRPFPCSTCSSRFRTKEARYSHQLTHSKEKRYACPFCDEKFRHWSTKTNHVANYHTGEAKFTCLICNARFSLSGAYKSHIKSHTGGVERTIPCTDCDKLFESNYKLKLHQATHSDERNVKCDHCDKAFKHRKNLLVHMRNHAGEKNYECPVCSMAFTQNLLLKGHVKRKHPDYQLPPAGTIVNKSFLEKLSVKLSEKLL